MAEIIKTAQVNVSVDSIPPPNAPVNWKAEDEVISYGGKPNNNNGDPASENVKNVLNNIGGAASDYEKSNLQGGVSGEDSGNENNPDNSVSGVINDTIAGMVGKQTGIDEDGNVVEIEDKPSSSNKPASISAMQDMQAAFDVPRGGYTGLPPELRQEFSSKRSEEEMKELAAANEAAIIADAARRNLEKTIRRDAVTPKVLSTPGNKPGYIKESLTLNSYA